MSRPQRDAGIREVDDDRSLEVWLEAVRASFNLPEEARSLFRALHQSLGWDLLPARHFYLIEDDVPVATAMVFRAAGVAAIYNLGTIPEARGRGFGRRVTLACLDAAIEGGLDVAVLHSSRLGVRRCEKLGFEEYCRFDYYLPPQAG